MNEIHPQLQIYHFLGEDSVIKFKATKVLFITHFKVFFCENVFGIREHFVTCSLQVKFHYAHQIVARFRFLC
jgi:hypothetical protein